jgi:uncharacterized protein YndB with AHSA1/START domain
MDTKKVIIEAVISAGSKKVWEYYTLPAHITKWNFASDDWHCPEAENDLRPGGKYRARMEAKDGSFGFDLEAVYDQVIDGKKISFTMTDGRKVDIEFQDMSGRTKVTTAFDPETENPVEMQRDGWQAILNNFKKYTETN